MNERNKAIQKLIQEKNFEAAAALINSKESICAFLGEEYSTMNYSEKVKFWAGNIGRQMRWNNEAGVDGMAVFSEADFKSWMEAEPSIDKILLGVIDVLKLNKKEVKLLLGLGEL